MKKVVSDAKSKINDDLYKKLVMRESYFQAHRNEKRKSKDVDYVKFIKSDDQKILLKDNDM